MDGKDGAEGGRRHELEVLARKAGVAGREHSVTDGKRTIGLALVFLSCLMHADNSSAQAAPRLAHVFVALADNQHQGIVPVPVRLGNGSDPANNLYWGAAFGVKTFFRASADWELVWSGKGPKAAILERCVFKHRREDVYVVADAYEGSRIREAVTDFLSAAAGESSESVPVKAKSSNVSLRIGGGADVVAYAGHDAFMDFQVTPVKGTNGDKPRKAIVLACASKAYFSPYLRETGAEPLLWTTGLMAPEAYTLEAVLSGWIAGEGSEVVRQRAARAYDKYQKCGLRAAQRLFTTGW